MPLILQYGKWGRFSGPNCNENNMNILISNQQDHGLRWAPLNFRTYQQLLKNLLADPRSLSEIALESSLYSYLCTYNSLNYLNTFVWFICSDPPLVTWFPYFFWLLLLLLLICSLKFWSIDWYIVASEGRA